MAGTTVAPTDGFVVDEEKMPKWQMSPLTKRRWKNANTTRLFGGG